MNAAGPVVVVTRTLPFGPKEAFLIPELTGLAQQADVVIIPARRGGPVVHADARPLCRYVPSPARRLRYAARAATDVRLLVAVLVQVCRVARLLPPRRALRTVTMIPSALVVAGIAKGTAARHVHAYWATDPATIALAATRRSGAPWSFTAHRYDIVADEAFALKADTAEFVRFISSSGVALADRCRGGRPPRARVVHLGVDVPARPAAITEARTEVVIACPAALVPVKGHDTLLHAFAEVAQAGAPVRLVLFGDGPERPGLEATARRLGIAEAVEFRGAVPHQQLLGAYASGGIDVVVLASRDLGSGLHEGIPVSLMEAMAHGLPVVTTRTGGVPELVEGAGVLIPPDDVAALAAALSGLVEDPAERARLAATGRRRVEEAFDARVTGAQLLRCIGTEAPA